MHPSELANETRSPRLLAATIEAAICTIICVAITALASRIEVTLLAAPLAFWFGWRALHATHAVGDQIGSPSREAEPGHGDLSVEMVKMQHAMEETYFQLEQANRQLEEEAATDHLTGVANKRTLIRALDRNVSISLRHDQPLSLLMLDVDHFKEFNDTHGHLSGDHALQMVAGTLYRSVRQEDLVARYGGEEFAVLLPHTDLPQAIDAAERIRLNIEEQVVDGNQVTVSIGVATLPLHGVTPLDLIGSADQALYDAKRAGRNQVAVAVSLQTGSEKSEKRLSIVESWMKHDPATQWKASVDSECPLDESFGGLEGLLQQPAALVLPSIMGALDVRDGRDPNHSVRVARYALRLAGQIDDMARQVHATSESIPFLTPGDMRDLALGSLLHDVGKLQVPEYIMQKTTAPTAEEWAIIRAHPVAGAEMIRRFSSLSPAYEVVRHHHERWDGTGYPDCLAGTEIPLLARIFAVCDAFDTLTSPQSRKRAATMDEARKEITRSAGNHFDPLVVKAFLEIPSADWQALSGHFLQEAQLKAA